MKQAGQSASDTNSSDSSVHNGHLLIKHWNSGAADAWTSSGRVIAFTRECRILNVFGLQFTAIASTNRRLQKEDSEPGDCDFVTAFFGRCSSNRYIDHPASLDPRMTRCLELSVVGIVVVGEVVGDILVRRIRPGVHT